MNESIELQTHEIRNIVIQHLRGDYSDSLTRFSYLNGGAEQFVQLTQNPDYTSYERELNLLHQILPRIREIISNRLQIIDFGVGDGRKSNQIISYFRERIETSYLGLDLSHRMIEIARRNNGHEGYYSVCDFGDMDQISRVLSGLPVNDRLIFLLGNTITNEVDIVNYLRRLQRMMQRRTYLVIGLELFQDNVNEILREYRNEENYELTFRPLQMLGIERNHGEINIVFNQDLQRVEEWFIFNTSGQVRDFHYQQGDRVLLSVTYKLTMNSIREIISNSGWREETSVVDRDYSLFLISPKVQ